MTIKLLAVGKTDDKELQKLIDQYVKRLKHYCKFKIEIIPDRIETLIIEEPP